MDKRTQLILTEFANWSSECRAEYKKRYQDPHVVNVRTNLTSTVKQALIAHLAEDIFDNYEAYDDTKDVFLEVAYQYFRLRVGEGYDATDFAIWDINEQETKWLAISGDVQKSMDLNELKASLSSAPLKIPLLAENSNTFDEIQKDALRIIDICKDQEYERRYGKSAVFERLGKASAYSLIAEMLPSKRGAPIKGTSPDKYRSFQFENIVKQISEALSQSNFAPTTAHEVTHLLIGEQEQVSSFTRKEEINWAMEHYFRASMITADAFLNSLSRGKKQPLVKVVSRIK